MSSHPTESGFEPLSWDSELFGFAVARLISRDVKRAIVHMHQAGVRLAYATVAFADHDARAQLEAVEALLVDRKLRFRKELDASVKSPLGIESWKGRPCTPELEGLAIASGHVSRFRVDPKVPEGVFLELYRTWIRRSVSGEIADEVLVIVEAGVPQGMVTLALPCTPGGAGIIGLIAVAPGSRGRGYGKRLLCAAEAWYIEHDASALEVVTQRQNSEACALYAARGCRVIADDAVYHLWIQS